MAFYAATNIYIAKMLINTAMGTPNLNLRCFVLCLNAVMAKNAPIPPIKKADSINAFSLIRHLPLFALDLSKPYIKNTTMFHRIYKAIITNCSVIKMSFKYNHPINLLIALFSFYKKIVNRFKELIPICNSFIEILRKHNVHIITFVNKTYVFTV